MIVTYVLSYLLLLLLHMHATASHEQKVCLGLGFLSGVLSLCFSFFFPLPLPASEIPSYFSVDPVGHHLSCFMVSSFLMCLFFLSGVLNYGTWEKSVESVMERLEGLISSKIMDCME